VFDSDAAMVLARLPSQNRCRASKTWFLKLQFSDFLDNVPLTSTTTATLGRCTKVVPCEVLPCQLLFWL
jgi:hypothetical protein